MVSSPSTWKHIGLYPLQDTSKQRTPSYFSFKYYLGQPEEMATLLQLKSLLHIKATLSFHQTHRTLNSQTSQVLQTPPVFTFFSSLHVFSCLRTICPITLVMWLTHPASFLSSGSSGLWLSYTHPGWCYSREHLKNVSSCQCPLTWFPCSGLKILQPLSHPRATRVLHCWCLCAKYFNKCSLMVAKVDFVLSEVYVYCSCPQWTRVRK